ncbi:MAG: adenylate/guanylate cyclase domain-containing protein [Chloroflexota bacterium]|nr:adenylate/guanylate cyclase domain-containing protein [Chloroflexota bacterium]
MQSPPPHTSTESTIVDELRAIRDLHNATAAALNAQKAVLAIRDHALPLAVFDMLDGIDDQLGALDTFLEGSYVELAQLRVLIETSALIATSFDLDHILSESMDVIVRLTGAERGYILLKSAETGAVEFRIAREASARTANDDVSTTIIERVLRTGTPLVTDNASSDPRMIGSNTVARFTLRSIICVPLLYKDQVTGAVYVDNRMKEAVFTENEMNLLLAFANQTAVAIENARLFADVGATLAEITRVKELLENVFASIVSGVITTGADDHILTFNRAAAQILALPGERAIGLPVQTLYPHLGDFDAALRLVLETNEPQMMETQAQIVGRGDVILSLKISPLRSASQVTQGAAMVMDDLTEARSREKTIETLRRYLPPGMIDNIEQIARLDLGGEKREVTAMFVYVRPYGARESDQPEAMMALLNQYFEVTTEIVHAARGIIDKYMGNEVMVLVNSQLNPMPDHAYRAVQIALDLRSAYRVLTDRLGVGEDRNAYRIGIHTGVATLGNVGSAERRSFTALGDSINLCKRLQENARPGQVLLSEATLNHILRHATRDELLDLRFDERDPVQVKGRQQSTRIYEAFRSDESA